LFGKARLDVRALAVASMSGALLGLVGTASFLAGRATADANQYLQQARLAAPPQRGPIPAALQHGQPRFAVALIVPQVATGEGPALPSLLQRIARQPSAPFHLAQADSNDLDCLTAAVYYEARGEAAAGQAAVAQVVLNRVRHPSFPKSVCGVVYQGAAAHACQFSFACDGAQSRQLEHAAWSRARGVAARALAGYVMNDVGRATYFHVAGLSANWTGEMVRIAQVGQHVFYSYSGHRGALSAADRIQASVSDNAAGALAVAAAADVATPAIAVVKAAAPDAAPPADPTATAVTSS
jgi:hypothetical protein